MQSNGRINLEAGFSLIELIVTLSIMIIIVAAVFSLVGSSIKFSNATYQITDAEQNLRIANEMINRDLVTVGDGLRGIGMIQTPIAFVANYLTQSPVNCPGSTTYVCMALVQSDDSVPGTTPIPLASPAVNVLNASDRLTLLTQDTSFTPITLLPGKITFSGSNVNLALTSSEIGRFQVGEIYAIASQNSIALGVISTINTSSNTLGMTNGDVYGINQTGVGSPLNVVSSAGTQPAAIIRLQIIHYYVDANNLLIRRVFGVRGAGFVDSVVAEHVTNLQFRYLVNLADANGFVPQPKTRLVSSTEQAAVREVETTLSVETARAINPINANSSGRQSISTTTATSVRNLQFRQAL